MASVDANVYKEPVFETSSTIPDIDVNFDIYKIENVKYKIIYALLALLFISFVKKLISTFCRRHDQSTEAKCE